MTHPRERDSAAGPAWLRDLAGAWIFYSVLPAWPWPKPRFQRIARFAPWVGAVLGLLQYLSPSMQALLGVWVFHEAFPQTRLIGFLIIWSALLLYVAEGLWQSKRAK